MNRTMAIKHKKARMCACKEYKDSALRESCDDYAEGRLKVSVDSFTMSKTRLPKRKLVAGVPRKKVSPLLLEYFGGEL